MRREGDGRLSKSIWAHVPVLTPEKKVWRAVLTQAMEDAEMTPVGDETAAEPLEASRARRYLRADSPFEAQDLKLVCDFADLPADRVLLWARRQYAPEQSFEKQAECGSRAAALLPAEPSFRSAAPLEKPEKRERCSSTPENGASSEPLPQPDSEVFLSEN